jgi:hypothetical protein
MSGVYVPDLQNEGLVHLKGKPTVSTKKSALSGRIAALYLLIFLFAGIAFASSEKVLYSFLGTPDGLSPGGGLVADKAGNL